MKRSMEQHRRLLQQVTAEWESKIRIHREAARYWDITRLSTKDPLEEKRATERYHFEMSQARFAHDKLIICLGLKSSL